MHEGTYTTKRMSPTATPMPFFYSKDGVVYARGSHNDLGINAAFAQVQETTSYRSGRTAQRLAESQRSPEARQEDELLAGGSWARATTKLGNRTSTLYSSRFLRVRDIGHEFKTTTKTAWLPRIRHEYVRSGIRYFVDDTVSIGSSNLYGAAYYRNPTNWDHVSDGTKAINKTIPTRSEADLAVTLAELKREGFPLAVGAATYQARSLLDYWRAIGQENLNVQFGINPIEGFLKDALKSVAKSGQTVRQFRRDSGRRVRRRYKFPVSNELIVSELSSGHSIALTDAPSTEYRYAMVNSSNGTSPQSTISGRESILQTRRVWFSGAYMYHLDKQTDLLDRLDHYGRIADKLLGTRFDLDAAWNLMPWSWFIDWNSNVGDVIANAEALSEDNLVLEYGYLMCETEVTRQITATNPPWLYQSTRRLPLSWTFKTLTKERKKANPYGFSLAPGDYTATQSGILTSLGMAKTPTIPF